MTVDTMQKANATQKADADLHDFHEQLKTILPRLRVYALSLTRYRDAADDLVHDTVVKALTGRKSFQPGTNQRLDDGVMHQVVKALTGRKSFQPGTNLSAWVFRIQRNEFISGLRRTSPTVQVDSVIADSLSHTPHQESRLVMREFMSA